jgi:hypothetical protein
MLFTTHSLEKEGCDKIEWVYQLATLKSQKEAIWQFSFKFGKGRNAQFSLCSDKMIFNS